MRCDRGFKAISGKESPVSKDWFRPRSIGQARAERSRSPIAGTFRFGNRLRKGTSIPLMIGIRIERDAAAFTATATYCHEPTAGNLGTPSTQSSRRLIFAFQFFPKEFCHALFAEK